MTAIFVEYDFHPVGQGLFASGVLRRGEEKRPRFTWVYDCGTESSQKLLEDAIDRMASWPDWTGSGKPKIDLVTLSHFDHDHISGLVYLLSKFSVGTLLLPYMPLWQRLVLAFAEGVDTRQDLFRFFVNPVSYLTDIDGADIEQIVFVPQSGDEGPPEEGEAVEPEGEGDGPWKLEVYLKKELNADESEDPMMTGEPDKTASPRLKVMRAGSAMHISGVWEFVPYNDARLAPKATSAFKNAVARKRDDLLLAHGDEKRNKALKSIKDAYDRAFGKSAKGRNEISLFLYGGPTRAFERSARITSIGFRVWPSYWLGKLLWTDCFHHGLKIGVLYTGDGYLNTGKKLASLLSYLGVQTRVKRFSVVQVMHHGASANWHDGVAGRLSPCISVFSSDPTNKRLKHPHPPVLRDFWPFGAVQVDKQNGFSVVFRLS